MAEKTPVVVDDPAALRRARCTRESAGHRACAAASRVDPQRRPEEETRILVVPTLMLTGSSREARRAREEQRASRAETKAALQATQQAASPQQTTAAVEGILAQREGRDA